MDKKRKRISFIGMIFIMLLICSGNVYAADSVETNIVELRQEGEDYVYIKWNTTHDADGYSVYRSVNNETLTLIKNVITNETYNYGLKNGALYTYAIRPYTYDENQNKIYGPFSNSSEIQIGVREPQNIVIDIISENSVNIAWDGDPMSEGYSLYRSEDGERWSLVKSIDTEFTTTYGLQNEKQYFFKLKAYRLINGKKRYSAYSETVFVEMGLNKPNLLKVMPVSANAIALSWEAVSGATAYRIYRSDDGSDYKLIKTVDTCSTKNYSLSNDVSYSYRVAAIKTLSSGKTIKSNYSEIATIKLQLDEVSEVSMERNSSSSLELSWDEVPQANAYRIYKVTEDGVAHLLKTVYKSSTITYGLEQGKIYGFSIKPIQETSEYTLSGKESVVNYFYNALPSNPRFEQKAIDKITIFWDKVMGAEKYCVYEAKDGSVERLAETAGTEITLSLTNSSNYLITAWRNNIESEAAEINTIHSIFDPDNSIIQGTAIGPEQINLMWNPVEYAINYEIKRVSLDNGEEKTWITDSTTYNDISVKANETYIYSCRIEYAPNGISFWGKWLPEIQIKTPSTPKYRAVLIGEENYMEVLNGPQNDVNALNNTLIGFDKMHWETNCKVNASKKDILSLIASSFAGATENDISMFYYSGHGVTGSGEYYSGALMTVDYEYITIQDLAELLSNIPGKVVVILDSCGSGAAISNHMGVNALGIEEQFDAQQFNNQVITAFASLDNTTTAKSKELASNKFLVLTASAYEENSRTVLIDNIWGGAFTRGVTGSCGYNYNSRIWNSTMDGDMDHNNILTLQECYSFAASFASKYQNAQVYPNNSSFKLFYK